MSSHNATCPPPMTAASNGLFQGDNPLHFALPLLIVQICLVVVLTRALAYLLRLFRQPRVIAEIIGGILLGPSALGRNKTYLQTIFPHRSLTVLDTIANLGLLFFLFLVGLELDLKSLRRTGKKTLSIALAGIGLPFLLGIGTSFVLRETISQGVPRAPFLVFMGVALSITAFPVLARILAELKLLTTDVGQLAMSAAAVNDIAAWILLALAISLSGTKSPLISLWVFITGFGFIAACFFLATPIFSWMGKRCTEGEPVNEIYICATLTAVLAVGFATDAIGIHALFGGFVLGILVPKEGPFAGALVEKVEDLVSGLFLPLYFVSSGLKTNVATIHGSQSWGLLVLVIFTACLGKIVGTIVVSLLAKIPFKEAVTLGFLMNTKGLVELIVLNIGRDRGVLNDQTFAIMVLMALFTTFITTPIVIATYKPARNAIHEYKDRTLYTIEGRNQNSQLRLLACFHSSRSIPSLINLIEISRGSRQKIGLRVYAMHLTELSERSSAILMVHKARKNGIPFWKKGNAVESEMVIAFEAYEQLSHVSIRPTTAISHMSNIHEDICTSAEMKKVSMIILPFHKHQRLDGHMETTRSELRHVNRRVLEHATCSVGVFIDRGLGGTVHVPASNVDYAITALFLGGPDDREAISYGILMAEHPGISLTIVRLVAVAAAGGESVAVDMDGVSRLEDEGFILEIKKKVVREGGTIKYEESVVGNGEVAMGVIMKYSRCNLYLVGRIPEGVVAAELGEKGRGGECPELGPIGSFMLSPEFSTAASVLVVQQHRGELSGDSLASLKEEDTMEGGSS